MKLHIIIPNYNGAHFLPDCLDSLRRQTYQNFKITVVDNGSLDESTALLQTHYPEVQILKSSRNQGFAAAANAGIQSSHAPYVMLLNNDTSLEPHCIQRLMQEFSRHPHAFSVSAHILSWSGKLTDTAGDYYSLFGYAFCRGQGIAPRIPKRRHSRQIFTGCGCATVYRRDFLTATGLFDENFFAYLEDVDIGFRARRLGFQAFLCPEAYVFHHGSGTTGSKYTPFKVYLSARNNIWLRKKNLTLLQRFFHAPFFLMGTLLKYFYFRRKNLGHFYRKGIKDGQTSKRQFTISSTESFSSYFLTEPWILYGSLLYILQFLRRR